MKPTIIGKTKSGKLIFDKACHSKHRVFNVKEHREASNLHWSIYDRAMAMLEEKRIEKPGFNPSQEAYNFIQKHQKGMVEHARKANDFDTKGLIDKKVLKMSREEVVNRINILNQTGKKKEARELYTLLENHRG